MRRVKRCLIFILFFLLGLSSCGGKNPLNTNSFNLSTQINEERQVSNEELKVATRICYAYHSKSINFRSGGLIGSNFIFSTIMKDCLNSIVSVQVNATLANGGNELYFNPPSFQNNNDRFYRTIQTDTSGYLSLLCNKVFLHEPVSNTVNEGGVKVQISFFREDLDTYLIQYFLKQSDNSYKIESAEKFKVRTQIDYTNGQILGMDESYLTQKACGTDRKTYSEFVQKFISR